MSDGASSGGTSAGDPVAAARAALDAAREAAGAAITAHAQARAEATRLRERAAAGGELEQLTRTAEEQEARAAALEPRIEQLRDLARRAEVAYEALRADDPSDRPAA
ncbi:hypothetical protein [Patulibacter defluvii]|uniref:hypothetical protein n=1 Tax=Patulibacter defluvii TaxID=3095358 RepID=UPI002A74A589|nr:hypothetical protein [Patulibacter sp. DM4]